MDFLQYQTEAYTNIKPHTDSKDEVLDYCISLFEEGGEVMNHIKHHFYGSEELSKEELAKEIGDVLWYLSSLCSVLNISLDTVAKINLGKLKFRYNNSFSTSKSKNRKENELKYTQTSDYQSLIKNINFKQ